MDAATQKLVDEARAEAERRWPGPLDARYQSDRQPLMERSAFRAGVEWALEAAQRPPVSPGVPTFAFTDAQWSAYQALPEQGYSHRAHLEWVVNAWLRSFSFLSQPVYDEEKIAQVIQEAANRSEDRAPGQTRANWYAAALVAALRSWELTREETNE